MSKKDKLLNKIRKTPPPKDFRWDDAATILIQNGFSKHCAGGSHYIFEHNAGISLSLSKTHPSGTLKPYQVKSVKEALTIIGAINEHDK